MAQGCDYKKNIHIYLYMKKIPLNACHCALKRAPVHADGLRGGVLGVGLGVRDPARRSFRDPTPHVWLKDFPQSPFGGISEIPT
jgi:hypothetical protein